MPTLLNHVDIAEIRDALTALVPERAEHGQSKFNLTFEVSRRFGGDGNWPGDKFAAQVGRVLDAMAKDGALVKVKRGDSCPRSHGWSTTDEPVYFTPGGWAVSTAKADAAAQAVVDHNDRSEALANQAKSLGLDVSKVQPYGAIKAHLTIEPETLAVLLAAYEKTVSAGHARPAGV
jgi:hypothetical protein